MIGFFLVHGGLWEPMDSHVFWTATGIAGGLMTAGHAVIAPNRLGRPASWEADTAFLAETLPPDPVVIVSGSNGVTPAVRLALEHRGLARGLVIAWPATCGDQQVDARYERSLTDQGADQDTITRLLSGQTLRGITDGELAALSLPVAVLPSVPENPIHQRQTVDRILTLVPGAVELPGSPEPPRPDFAPSVPGVLDALSRFARRLASS